MHPIPACLRLIQINRGGPATTSCAEGVRGSSPARQRGAPPPSMRPGLIWVDAVEKVPNCFATNFPPKDETRDDCSSICPQASYRSHGRVHRFMMPPPDTFIRLPRLRLGEFVLSHAKRLFRQHRPGADFGCATGSSLSRSWNLFSFEVEVTRLLSRRLGRGYRDRR